MNTTKYTTFKCFNVRNRRDLENKLIKNLDVKRFLKHNQSFEEL